MRRLATFALHAGIVAAVFGLSKAHAVAHGYDFSGSSRFGWAIAYVAFLSLAAYACGLPDRPVLRSRAFTAVLAPALAATVMSVTQLLLGDALLPRAVVFGTVVVLVPWNLLLEHAASDAHSRDRRRDRVVVVAGPDELDQLGADARRHPLVPFTIVETLTVGEATPINNNDEALVDRAITSDATLLVLSRAAQADEGIVGQAATLHEAGVRVRSLTAFYEEWVGKLPLSELERLSLMFDIGEVHRAGYPRVKRIADVGAALMGTVVLVLVLPFVLLANLAGNRGALFFRQTRVGRDGRCFTMLKLRTMRGAASGNAEWTGECDPRITRVGALLRRSHLDELPQVINVLRGDLSVVGPRPEQPQYVAELRDKIPFYDLRHLVRPGLTGWAQVNYSYGASDEDAMEKLQYEFWYLRHQSIALDARVVLRTARHVLGGGGR